MFQILRPKKLREKSWPADVDFRFGLSNEKSERKEQSKVAIAESVFFNQSSTRENSGCLKAVSKKRTKVHTLPKGAQERGAPRELKKYSNLEPDFKRNGSKTVI